MSSKQAESPVTQPIINTPFTKPELHWALDSITQRATDKKLTGRRRSGGYLPVPSGSNIDLSGITNASDTPPHTQINDIRDYVEEWRKNGRPNISKATRDLLDYWGGQEVTPRPFFCQIEAVETIIWLVDAAAKSKDGKQILKQLNNINAKYNESILRYAIKMATGTGKTQVMAMLIAWLAVNRKTRVDIVVITPGLTVKERLQELDPSKNPATYKQLLPLHLRQRINQVRVSIFNFHVFNKRSTLSVAGENDVLSGTGRRILTRGNKQIEKTWLETDRQMLDRVLKSHSKRKLIVFNDEAHHCYMPSKQKVKTADAEEKLEEQNAALWFNALRSLKNINRLDKVIDLSATPMYLRVPIELNSEIFPWTVSDYPLIEAVEAGLTKIPRVPTDDDSDSEEPVYRNVYANTSPKKINILNLPSTVTTLLEQMYEHYRVKVDPVYAKVNMTPVMIVVANTIENARALYGHIAGYQDKTTQRWEKGGYELFSNVRPDSSGPVEKPPTLLVHSGLDQLEDLPANLKNILVNQAQMHVPEASSKKEQLAIIREIFNTVGKKNKLGEHIRCIVSVSMLTEGWDTRTVTHIFGYRKFGTQLLCEQVAGRGLRRTSFELNGASGKLKPEMVNIFGVPFNFMRASGDPMPFPPPEPYQVFSLPDRRHSSYLKFPNLVSYRFEQPQHHVFLDPSKVEEFSIEPTRIPSMTELMGTIGESHISELTEKRRKHVIYKVAANVVATINANEEFRRRSLFSSVMTAVEQWLQHPDINCPDLRLLLVPPHIETVPREIAKCCTLESGKELRIIPKFADMQDREQPRYLDTSNKDFLTTKKPVHSTSRSELNLAPCDSNSEIKVAQALDSLTGIKAWARNFHLGWQIPYLDIRTGIWRNYVPDFLCKLTKKTQDNKPIYLVIEYKGQVSEDSDQKAEAVRNWWIPAVSNSDDDCCSGEWRYVFINHESKIQPLLRNEINS